MPETIKIINASQISDPKNPMRSEIDREGIFNLAESIKREGLINPITVRPVGSGYEVVAGHRRFLACKLANVIEIPCVVRELSDDQADEIMAHENLERQDVNVVEEALLLGRLVGESEENIPKVAERMNRSRAWVESRLEILEYPPFLIAHLAQGAVSLGVAHWIGLIKDEFWQKQYSDQAASNGMSVVQASYLYELWKQGGSPPPADFLPQDAAGNSNQPPRILFTCAACGKPAEAPNLQSLICHKECPSSEDVSPLSPVSSESSPPPPAKTGESERGQQPARG